LKNCSRIHDVADITTDRSDAPKASDPHASKYAELRHLTGKRIACTNQSNETLYTLSLRTTSMIAIRANAQTHN